MNEPTPCIMSTENTYKVCVGDDLVGCSEGCIRMKAAHTSREERINVLRQYEALVDIYNEMDFLIEQVQYSTDEDVFNKAWRDVEKAAIHMKEFKAKHNITSEDFKELYKVKKATSVADAIKILGGK